jgi:hypothetical protein
MHDVRESLQRAFRELPGSEQTLERLEPFHGRRATRRRLTAAMVGLTITAVLLAGLFLVRPRGDDVLLQPAGGRRYGLQTGERYDREVRFYQLVDAGAAENGASDPCVPPHCPAVYEHTDRYAWDAGDGTDLSRARQVFFDPAERAAYEHRLGVDTGWTGLERDPFPGTALDGLDALPTDPASLRSWFENGNTLPNAEAPLPTDATAVELWHSVYWDLLYSEKTASPALRVAGVQLLSGLPGVSIDDAATDPAGRPSLSLRMLDDFETGGAPAEEWIYVDPETLAPTAFVVRWAHDDLPTQIQLIATDTIVDAAGTVQQTFVPPLTDDVIPFGDPRVS